MISEEKMKCVKNVHIFSWLQNPHLLLMSHPIDIEVKESPKFCLMVF